MDQAQYHENDDNLWNEVFTSERAFIKARMNFFAGCVDKVTVIRKALHVVTQRGTALRILLHMKVEERQQLFDEVLALASVSHSDIALCREVILSLPREWLLSNIEQHGEALLHNGTYEEYRRLIELYSKLDLELASRLAMKALQQEDEDIREAGEDFLEWFKLGLGVGNYVDGSGRAR